MATAPPASYPGNALLCHCERRQEGGREKSTPPFGRTVARPTILLPTASPLEKLDETAETPWTLIPSIATRGPTNSAWPSPNYPSLYPPALPLPLQWRTRGSCLFWTRSRPRRSPRSYILRNRGIFNETVERGRRKISNWYKNIIRETKHPWISNKFAN